MTVEQLAYFAGFVDGEGSISINRYCVKAKSRIRFAARVMVGQTDRIPLDLGRQLFGGSIQQMSVSRLGAKPIWIWSLWGKTAANFLRAILPYLIVKREQAIALIEFSDKIHELKPKNSEHDTPEIKAYKEEVYLRLRELKKAA